MQNQDRAVVHSSNEGRRIVTPIGYRRSARIAYANRGGNRLDRESVGASIIKPYRTKLTEPRIFPSPFGGAPLEILEDPAPDWVAKLVWCAMPHVGGETDDGRAILARALGWCATGSHHTYGTPEWRSAFLRSIIGDREAGTFGLMRRGLVKGARMRFLRDMLDACGAAGEPRGLSCPGCFKPHIDYGEWAVNVHRTHLCEGCGLEWQPFVWATRGATGDELTPGATQ